MLTDTVHYLLAEALMIGVFALFSWVLARRDKALPKEGELVEMEHPGFILAMGLLGECGVIAAATLYVLGNVPRSTFMDGCLLVMQLMMLALIAEYFRARHWLTREGFWYRGLLKRRDFYEWSRVCRVAYSVSMRWFVVETQDGRTARFHLFLSNTPALARELLRHGARHVEPDAFPILEATVAGRPPPAIH